MAATRTSIIIVAYNHRQYLEACFASLDDSGLDRATTRVLFVDNASSDGSYALVADQILAGGATTGGIACELIRSDANLGFAGGNNLAIARAALAGDDFVYFLNPDTRVEPGFLAEAVAAAAGDPSIALVQSLVLRDGEDGIVNTFGNAFHFLGFGYAAGDGTSIESAEAAGRLGEVRDIAVASGAASLARLAILEAIGPFDDELFLYHEDAELSMRARLAGLRVVFAPRSRVRHHYQFSRNPRKLYFLQRNRWLVLAWHLRVRTLALLAPALIPTELGLWALAWRQGWLAEMREAWTYLLAPGRWSAIRAKRARVQALRRVPDRVLTAAFAGEINFPATDSWIVRSVANPVLAAYWRVAKRAIRW
jgi:GT2 family glycosyltransferase